MRPAGNMDIKTLCCLSHDGAWVYWRRPPSAYYTLEILTNAKIGCLRYNEWRETRRTRSKATRHCTSSHRHPPSASSQPKHRRRRPRHRHSPWMLILSIGLESNSVSIGTDPSIAASCSILMISGSGFPKEASCLLLGVGNKVRRCDPGEIVSSMVFRVLKGKSSR